MSAPGFYVLAAPIGDTGANSFLNDSPAGKALVAICGAVAVVIVVFAVFRMINGIGRGRPGEAFKSLIFGLLIGGLLFNLNLTLTGVNMMGDLVGKIFTSVDKVSNSGN
ncbi:hypothetical protein [Actinomadura sp. WMMA1423]|uniref:hypothetical protein n=1 Tax=Actinomadura sp. WMMA1423 TaxID=2591108 RepID=UPI001146FDD2|nr:hypothetical protein [Actinomadura sp. WMMA1423]